MFKQILLALIVLSPCVVAAQSPWPRSKAGFYVQGSWNFIPTYEEVFTESAVAKAPLDRKISEQTFQLYGEYGLNKRTTLIASLPVRWIQNGDFLQNFPAPETEKGRTLGLGNASLGIRRAIREGNVRLTGALRVDFPSTGYSEKTGLRTGYNAWTFVPMLSTGMGLRRAYWFAYGGYGLRTSDYSHFLNAGAEAGLRIRKCWLIGFSEIVYSLENGKVVLPLKNRINSLYVDKQGYWSLGVKAIVEFNRFWGFNLSAAGAGWGQFVPKRPGLGVGAYFKWD